MQPSTGMLSTCGVSRIDLQLVFVNAFHILLKGQTVWEGPSHLCYSLLSLKAGGQMFWTWTIVVDTVSLVRLRHSNRNILGDRAQSEQAHARSVHVVSGRD